MFSVSALNGSGEALRLLPWSGEDGKPCYLAGGGNGYISRMADEMEDAQLDMAAEILGHAADMLADSKTSSVQLRFLVARMSEALRDVCRVAESRGARIPEPPCTGADDSEG
ncbi:hypothetical protein ACIQ7D_09665 [Streptomyces sp. NPDC096310]|uniref:hypothetical protein n=1 Tax=Streptomyces sp. NPDC096310 TaxID=3366082 RepID=UPI00382DF4DA